MWSVTLKKKSTEAMKQFNEITLLLFYCLLLLIIFIFFLLSEME